MKTTFFNKLFLVIFVFLLSLGQLQRIELGNGIAFYFHDILILISLIFNNKIIIKNLKKNKLFKKKINWIFFGWILLGWGLAIWQNSFDFRILLYTGRLIAYILFSIYFKNHFKESKKIYLLITKLILIFGFLQYFLLADLRFLFYGNWDDHYYRLVSTILDPAFTALIFVFAIINYLNRKKLRKNDWLFLILFSIGLLLSYSRAGYLSMFMATMSLFLIKKESRKLLISFLFIFVLSVPFLPNKSGGEGVNLRRTYSIESRFNHDREILKNLSPLEIFLGEGLFNPQKIEHENHARFADSWPAFLISNIGIGGLILVLNLLIREVLRLVRERESQKLALITALLVHGLFNNDLSQSFIIIIFLGFYL